METLGPFEAISEVPAGILGLAVVLQKEADQKVQIAFELRGLSLEQFVHGLEKVEADGAESCHRRIQGSPALGSPLSHWK